MDLKDMMMVIAIDPGVKGALASMLFNNETHEMHMVRTHNMPVITGEISKTVDYIVDKRTRVICFIENITIQGPLKPGESQFKVFRSKKLLDNYMKLVTVFEMKGIKIESIMPMTWQSGLQLRTKGKKEEYKDKKAKFKKYATAIFPQIKVTPSNADALCLLEFGRRKLIYEPKKYL